MNARAPILRRLALCAARHAAFVMPPGRSSWAEAMLSEVELIEDDRAALGWAMGAVQTSYVERIRAMELLQTRRASCALALLALWRAFAMIFAPALTAAYRLHAVGIAEFLGARTPGDDYRRFIPLMDATPTWLFGLGAVSGLFYLLAAFQLVRNGRGAFALFAIALSLGLAQTAAMHLVPGLAQLDRQAFTFAEPNIRRDFLLPAGRLALLVMLGAALWFRDRPPRAQAV